MMPPLRGARGRVVFKPELPPYALLHYKDFDQVCAYLGGVCEYLEVVADLVELPKVGVRLPKAFALVYTKPQLAHVYFKKAVFRGRHKNLWYQLALGKLPVAFERWPRLDVGNCPKLVWRFYPSVLLRPPEEGFPYIVKSTDLVQLLRELGIRFWFYKGKRPVVHVWPRPWDALRLATSRLPSAEVLGACGYHGAASTKYWADTGKIRLVEFFLEKARPILPATSELEGVLPTEAEALGVGRNISSNQQRMPQLLENSLDNLDVDGRKTHSGGWKKAFGT